MGRGAIVWRAAMNVAERVRIVQQLGKLNVDLIEAGFPTA